MRNQREVLAWNPQHCLHCFGCINACPSGALTVDHEHSVLSYDIRRCYRCNRCIRSCPSGALHVEPIDES